MNKGLEALNDLSNMVGTYYNDTREHRKAVNVIKQELERLYGLEQIWKGEWCGGMTLNADGLKTLFKHDSELFEEKTTLDDTLNLFKLAFYTLWKCCNCSEISTDVPKENDTYLEFKCGFESVFIPVSEFELNCIKKACDLLDINVKEALNNAK